MVNIRHKSLTILEGYAVITLMKDRQRMQNNHEILTQAIAPPITQIITELKHAITQKYSLLEMRLFGSTVRGDARKDSDIDIFVMPSKSEAFGVAAIESQSMEIPVVASRIGGIPEAVQDGITGILVKPGDSD